MRNVPSLIKEGRRSSERTKRRATVISSMFSTGRKRKKAETSFGSALRVLSGIIDRKKEPPRFSKVSTDNLILGSQLYPFHSDAKDNTLRRQLDKVL